jgi:hypothetical protein
VVDRIAGSLPPLSTTGVEEGTAGALSWLTGSIPADDAEGVGWWVWRDLSALSPQSSHRPRARFYETGAEADDGSYAVLWGGVGDAAGTVGVECRQTLLERLGRARSVDLVLGLLQRGVRPSRIDLVRALVRPAPVRPADLMAAWQRGAARTRVRTGKLWTELDGRQGLFVGSRSSDRYARLYETAGAFRLETESKRGRAEALGSALLDGADVDDLWRAELLGAIDWPGLSGWAAVTAG